MTLSLVREPSCRMSSLLSRTARPSRRLLVLMMRSFSMLPFRLPMSTTCQPALLTAVLLLRCRKATPTASPVIRGSRTFLEPATGKDAGI